MGCDIHPYVEEKINGVWVYKDNYQEEKHQYRVTRFPSNRDYHLFSVLANVRNQYASGSKVPMFPFISEPKGIPDDLSEFVQRQIVAFGTDGHSHSYLTLREIIEFDWNQRIRHPNDTRTVGDMVGWKVIYKIFKISEDWDNTRIVFFFDN